jgi:hypothetical protein
MLSTGNKRVYIVYLFSLARLDYILSLLIHRWDQVRLVLIFTDP